LNDKLPAFVQLKALKLGSKDLQNTLAADRLKLSSQMVPQLDPYLISALP